MTIELRRKKKSDVDRKKREQLQDLAKRKSAGAKLTFQERISALAIKTFGQFSGRLEQSMPTLGEDLMMSNYFLSPQAFLSMIIFVTILSIPIAALGLLMTLITRSPMFLSMALVPIAVFAIGLTLPKTSRSSRANAIDGELAFVVGYLSVLITGGISAIELFRRLSLSKLYPASAKEARRILLN